MKLKPKQLELFVDKINVTAHAEGSALTYDVPAFTRDLAQKIIAAEEAPKTIAAGAFDIDMAIGAFGLRFNDYGPGYIRKFENIPDIQVSPTSVDKINVTTHAEGSALTYDVPAFTRDLAQKIIAAEEAPKTIAAGAFDIDMAIGAFGLRFNDYAPEYTWNIEHIPDIQVSPTSSVLDGILAMYAQTVDRSSEAACRTPVDLILIQCVAELQGKTKTPSNGRAGTPPPHRDVKICFEVSFSHQLNPKPTGKAAIAISHATTVNGRVDYGVGIITGGKLGNRRFHSLLIAVKAKANNLDSAFSRLVVYLACLRQARLGRGRTDCSVYGIASDGYEFYFMTITHEGDVKVSRRFGIARGEMTTIIGGIMYILRKSLERSLTVTPDKANDESSDEEIDETDDQDNAMKIDDNDFLHPTDNEY